MHKRELRKPDGRKLTLYSERPIPADLPAPSPRPDAVANHSYLRWHPLRREWVTYASHRQNRTFLPPKEFNPLAPMTGEVPTELPAGDYDMAVFDNLFASLALEATEAPPFIVPTRGANGHCEVVVFTQDPSSSLGALSLDKIHLLLQVWRDRYLELSKEKILKYALPFENRGVEMGVTLHHPHGQIYAYPFLPPVIETLLQSQRAHFEERAETLLSKLLRDEEQDGRRIVVRGDHTLAFVPVCARYPYEMWVAPKRPVRGLTEMSDDELKDLARTLKTVLLKYENLWQRPFPYLMLLYAAPIDGEAHPEWHFHIEFFPPYRTRDKLKYLAGTELGAGLFINDSLPEEKAAELRAVEVQID